MQRSADYIKSTNKYVFWTIIWVMWMLDFCCFLLIMFTFRKMQHNERGCWVTLQEKQGPVWSLINTKSQDNLTFAAPLLIISLFLIGLS